jgi:hypothetical protein
VSTSAAGFARMHGLSGEVYFPQGRCRESVLTQPCHVVADDGIDGLAGPVKGSFEFAQGRGFHGRIAFEDFVDGGAVYFDGSGQRGQRREERFGFPSDDTTGQFEVGFLRRDGVVFDEYRMLHGLTLSLLATANSIA